jgi:hypothetical protein
MIAGCERCSEQDRPTITDYVLERPHRCLPCGGQITERTLVEWNPEYGIQNKDKGMALRRKTQGN